MEEGEGQPLRDQYTDAMYAVDRRQILIFDGEEHVRHAGLSGDPGQPSVRPLASTRSDPPRSAYREREAAGLRDEVRNG